MARYREPEKLRRAMDGCDVVISRWSVLPALFPGSRGLLGGRVEGVRKRMQCRYCGQTLKVSFYTVDDRNAWTSAGWRKADERDIPDRMPENSSTVP